MEQNVPRETNDQRREPRKAIKAKENSTEAA
jgi:hypothetical protein